MKSRLEMAYFKGPQADSDFNAWSEKNPKIEVKDLQFRVLNEGLYDGCLAIVIVYEVPSNILTLPTTT